jgi:flagellar motor switch protein FliG
MHVVQGKEKRLNIVKNLAFVFGAEDLSRFASKDEEEIIRNNGHLNISKEECIKLIKEDIALATEELSNLAEIHPAWIVKAIENESPKIIGIILRWLPSRHVRYILDKLPKKVKLSLPKLVESFAVPTQVLNLIKAGFERKFNIPQATTKDSIKTFDDCVYLKTKDLEVVFKDLGMHELAMAFQNVDQTGVKVLLNRMSVSSARALQHRIKDVADENVALLRDARYSLLEVAMDQEDIDKLLIEIGIASFSKALKNDDVFSGLQLKLDPEVSYLFKRYIDQHINANKLADIRQGLIMERLSILSRAGEIETSLG